ncbi:solute carrier family 41 member 1-like [Brevipalpus obovatus]|uniref:solute carrier family 41 member 1-like n=1 Tax=Brevipalpus obovatus TaxID=246614 RepID=UPI003D9FB036
MLNTLNRRLRSFSLNLDSINSVDNGTDRRRCSSTGHNNHQVIIQDDLSSPPCSDNNGPVSWYVDEPDRIRFGTGYDNPVFNELNLKINGDPTPKIVVVDTDTSVAKSANIIQPISVEKLEKFHTESYEGTNNFLRKNVLTNQRELKVPDKSKTDLNDWNNNPPYRKDRSSSTYSRISFVSFSGQRKSRPELLQDESPYKALRELIIPCLIAGFGNVATGVILAMVQTWEVFENVPQLNILVPALLGLKGNVEMTLASRLSTHANLGDLDDPIERNRMIIGNMALVQCQASTVGFIAPMIALAVSYISPTEGSDLTLHEAILLMAGSVITANLANLFLGSLMCTVVILSRRFKINPDNIATPIAASFGDLTTMLFIAYISKMLFRIIHMPWIQIGILIATLSIIPFLALIASKQKCTRRLLVTSWFPICGAMLLQITGGLIMEHSLEHFTKLAAFQPVINGVGGNLAAVQTSRISTYLHRRAPKKCLPEGDENVCSYPGKVFFNEASAHSTMARLLLCLSIPSHILFIFLIKLVRDRFTMTPLFFTCYLVAAVFQVAILIQISYTLVHFLWRKGFNPDNSALPFLTALGDLIGSALLAVAFVVLMLFSDINAEISSEPNIHKIIHPSKYLTTTPASTESTTFDAFTTLMTTNFTKNL